MNDDNTACGCLVLGCIFIILWFFLAPLITMWAWNVVVPSVFNGPTIDYIQALGINLLVGIITGGLRLSVRGKW